jgi:hypothetical protein
LQVCTPLPEQSVVPGVHTPTHWPLTHAWFEQAMGALQTPPVVHVWTPFPEHWVAPGVQSQAHAPELQAPQPHATAVLHTPVASHVCTLPPVHCVEPGTHTPEHCPVAQVYGQGVPAPQPPFESHLCSALPEHRI